MEWAAVVSAVFGLLLYVLKRYDAKQPQRDQEANNERLQQGRRDIADGNAAAVSDRIDRLLTQSNHSTGQPSREVTAERIRTVFRMVDSGRSTGKDSGESGELR